MAVGGEGAGGFGNLVKQRFGWQKWGFTLVLATFQKVRWVQVAKELTLSVLEDVSRRKFDEAYPTRRLEVLKAPQRIYVAFGEHPAAGVCVCVCSSKLDSSGLVV